MTGPWNRVLAGGLLASAGGCGFRIDASTSDAVPAIDVSRDGLMQPDSDGVSCTPITGAAAGMLVAPMLTSAPVLDGDLAEWTTCFMALDQTTAGLIRNLGTATSFPGGVFSVAHRGGSVFVAARLDGLTPLGSNGGPEIYENDGIAVYIDADGILTSPYGSDATQIVIDHAARIQGFRASSQVSTPAALRAVQVSGQRITIELEVTPATFGRSSFATTVGFDISFNDGDGANQISELVWFQACNGSSGCLCSSGDDAPYCDSRQFGMLNLLP